MNTVDDIQSLTNDQLNWLAAEAMGYPGVGYYGPNKSGDDGATHQDYDRFDTKTEALERYREYWLGAPGCTSGADMDEDDINLCYWKENWGPLMADQPADDGCDSLWDSSFEDWFFENHPQFTITVHKSKSGVSVDISHDLTTMVDAYFDDGPEHRLRTMVVLETLKQFKQCKR